MEMNVNNVYEGDESQNLNEQNSQSEDIDVTGENSVIVEQVVTNYDPDEKIILDFFNAGKTTVSFEELRKAGFDKSRIAAYTFNIGEFTLSRFNLSGPYTIEKNI